MPLKNEQVPELHRKMPKVTSETVEKTIVFGGFTATAGCYCYLLPAIVHQKQLPTTSYPTSYSDLWTAPATKAPADSKTPCHWRTNTTKSTCRQQNTMPLKDEQVPELHRKMPNVTSETVEKTIVFGGFTATAGCYCHLLPATCAPKAAEHKHQLQLAALLLLLVSRLTTKSTCRQQNTMPLKDEQVPEFHGKLLVSSRLTTKSTCRQQNTMPLKDEQLLEFHGKMPNVTSETVEKTLLLLLAACYLCTKSSWTQAPKAAGCSATATCEPPHHQKHLPTAKHHAIEGRTPPKAPADSKTPCHWRTNKSQNCTERCLTLLLKP